MLMVFRAGPGAPSGPEVGRVVNMPVRYLRFPWWVNPPQGAKLGDMTNIRPVPPLSVNLKKEAVEYRADLSVPHTRDLAPMRFRKCSTAPSGYVDGRTYILPRRYGRYPWFKLVETP
jgi:hypothetical protein